MPPSLPTRTTSTSLELSCDGPLRPPFLGFIQGGLTYASGKLGVLSALSKMLCE